MSDKKKNNIKPLFSVLSKIKGDFIPSPEYGEKPKNGIPGFAKSRGRYLFEKQEREKSLSTLSHVERLKQQRTQTPEHSL